MKKTDFCPTLQRTYHKIYVLRLIEAVLLADPISQNKMPKRFELTYRRQLKIHSMPWRERASSSPDVFSDWGNLTRLKRGGCGRISAEVVDPNHWPSEKTDPNGLNWVICSWKRYGLRVRCLWSTWIHAGPRPFVDLSATFSKLRFFWIMC